MTGGPGPPFPLTGPLPTGRTVIEASAGTGKTFTLASMATRYIAEAGVAPSELLMVTFTRAATGELRARVRDQLTTAAAVLAEEARASPHDPLMAHLLGEDRARRLERLRRGITEFDAATIITIHGFAAQVRSTLGLTAAVDPDARLVGNIDHDLAQVCADLLAGAASTGVPADLLPALGALTTATRDALARPDVALEPHSADQGAAPALLELRRLVLESVDALNARRRAEGTLSFDDVLVQLRDALCGEVGRPVVEALRSRFTVALIDEFQDTDAVQWDIFRTVFGEPGTGTTLVLVGDPKQSIYRFRGADVRTYLEAVGQGTGTHRFSLVTNWRADGAVVRSLGALFDGATFGDPAIRYQPVAAAPEHEHQRLMGPDGIPLPSLDLRLAVGGGIGRISSGHVRVPEAETAVNLDLVDYLRSLLGRAELPHAGGDTPGRLLRPSDVAVLVGSGVQAEAVQSALRRQGVPAVVHTEGNVLETRAAAQVRLLVAAMTRPSDARAVRAYALSWFVGASADQVAALDDQRLVPFQEQLAGWASLLLDHPVADVLAQVWADTGVVPRVLGRPDGDRHLTDLDHLAELLHAKTPRGRSGAAGLTAVLDGGFEEVVDADVEGGLAARRIESEADAVQIMTIWKAKGLEFPVVCVPTLWHYPTTPNATVYTDPATGRRACDLAKGRGWPDRAGAASRRALADQEVTGEHLRLLYVALTRARHQTVVWWANGRDSAKTALARILFARSDGAIEPDTFTADRIAVPADDETAEVLGALAGRSGGTIAITPIDRRPGATDRWSDAGPGDRPKPLGLARFDTALDRSVRRWSFSSIIGRGAVAGFDPFDWSLADSGAADEPGGSDPIGGDPGARPRAEPDGGSAAPSGPVGPLAALPAGTAFGTLVHAVLEHADFSAPMVEAELAAALEEQLQRFAVDLTPVGDLGPEAPSGRDLLVAGLSSAVGTTWGRRFGGLGLAAIGPADRLNEVSFDLWLGRPGRHPSGREIGQLVLGHLAPDAPLTPWAEGLAEGSIEVELAGHLTGSIDLVARVPGVDGTPRFVVADYKTNLLTPRGSPPAADDYRQDRLVAAMAEHHYPLQALLYAAALHRYLRWRLRGYEPAAHLGGAVYLFLRGMTGSASAAPGDGPPDGVFDWAIPPTLVVALSDLLDGRPAPAVSR
jgi:exodeoxyribonuclease V beta subunit